jgi:hypothetical protein
MELDRNETGHTNIDPITASTGDTSQSPSPAETTARAAVSARCIDALMMYVLVRRADLRPYSLDGNDVQVCAHTANMHVCVHRSCSSAAADRTRRCTHCARPIQHSTMQLTLNLSQTCAIVTQQQLTIRQRKRCTRIE